MQPQIGQTYCYWSKGADKPLAAICVDAIDQTATLQIFTAAGGRFQKTVGLKTEPGAEGWAQVGQRFH